MKRSLLAIGALLFVATSVLADDKNPVVIMDTSAGTIKIMLMQDKSPITVKNFLDYVEAKHFDNTVFHRVIPGFMIQGGGFEAGMIEKKTRPPIVNESSNMISNGRGTIAMARTNNPNSATAQFFINLVDNKRLDKSPRSDGYCAFGKVIDGMDVVDKIAGVKTGTKTDAAGNPHENVPLENVVIKSVRLAKD